MDFDIEVKLAVYRHFARTGTAPSPDDVAAVVGSGTASVREAYTRLCAQRVLVLEADGVSIRMAPPFSGVPTQHRIESAGVEYHANCAWDALGVVAALGRPGVVRSRCEQSGDPLRLEIGEDGPASSDWVFHCEVPAAQWWDDIAFT
jgi:hypothetical protein